MARLYILQAGIAIPTNDMAAWSMFMASDDRVLKTTDVFTPGAETVRVSTVFLGLDHNYFGRGAPVLWETMVFGGPHDMDQRRYTSAESALEGHQQTVSELRLPVTG